MTEVSHEQQLGTFDQLNAEAIQFMEREGFAHIKGYASPEQCHQVTDNMDDDNYFGSLNQSSLIEDRLRYSLYFDSSDPHTVLAKGLKSELKEMAATRSELQDWAREPQMGIQSITDEIYRYKDGTSFARHRDDPNDGFPTQALVTLQGGAVFNIFETMDAEQPKASIKVEAGDVILWRGDEVTGGQLPHSVDDNHGDRILLTLYPHRDFKSAVNWARSRQEQDKSRKEMQYGRVRRTSLDVGRRVMWAIKGPDKPNPPAQFKN
jgi:hypothetical protein